MTQLFNNFQSFQDLTFPRPHHTASYKDKPPNQIKKKLKSKEGRSTEVLSFDYLFFTLIFGVKLLNLTLFLRGR